MLFLDSSMVLEGYHWQLGLAPLGSKMLVVVPSHRFGKRCPPTPPPDGPNGGAQK